MRLWPRSLTTRLLLTELAVLALAILIVPPLTITVLHGAVAGYQDNVLRDQVQSVAAALRRMPTGEVQVELPKGLKPIFATGYDGRAYMIVDRNGRLLTKSPFGSATLAAAAPRNAVPERFDTRAFVGISMPVLTDGDPLWAIVTQDLNQPGVILDDVVRAFLRRYLVILLPLIFLLPFANSLIVRRFVVVLRNLSRRAEMIDARTLFSRLPEERLPTEIAPLVQAVNRLIERLEASFRQQKEFSGNVAHELRTPLATLQLSVDAVAARDLREKLLQQIARLSHVLSQLRDLASLETTSDANLKRLNLTSLIVAVVAEIAPFVVGREHIIQIENPNEPVFILGNPTLIGLAIRNLIDNAMRHTPTGTTIEITLDQEGSVVVSDDGPGIVTEDLDLLIRRFWRADHERSDSAGIGLSIVQQIMNVHRGSLEICNLTPRGASFKLAFRPVDEPRTASTESA